MFALCVSRAALPGAAESFAALLPKHNLGLRPLYLVEQLGRDVLYEALDGSAVATRDINRRGNGWLPGIADYGKSNCLGFYEGVHLLISVTPLGAITGFGFGPASMKDSALAETFLAARAQPQPRLPSVGQPAYGDYVADKGFSQDADLARWLTGYGANVICVPKSNSLTRTWPKELRRWLESLRQIVETVFDELHNTFRLTNERPHDLTGLQTRLAAKIALHNFWSSSKSTAWPRATGFCRPNFMVTNMHQAFKKRG